MSLLLSKIESPADLHRLSEPELETLTQEIRDELVRVLTTRPAHFASNLGVVELCLALHLTYDFRFDRLIWDTGHQVYPHKLITGRFKQFHTIRTKGGLMGYPNPNESPYDLFMTGHAACSISSGIGLKVGDDLMGQTERHSVVVIGDGSLPSGIAYEALNNAGELGKKFLVILNDNKMSICPRTGSVARALDRARVSSFYRDSKAMVQDILSKVPIVGNMANQALEKMREGLKATLTGGMLFEELGFRYFGPVDGHDLTQLRKALRDMKQLDGPVLLHVLTTKGQGVPEASEDPVKYHTPPVFTGVGPERQILSLKSGSAKAYTDAVSGCIYQALKEDPKVAVITAAMCQGNKLEKVRDDFPDRFFDVGICESHGVAFAAGLAKAGIKPIVAIYSTFLQRSYDQLFQEVSLQNLPVMFCLDRGGLTGPDGPTHHGTYDIPYLRIFPNFVVMAPGDSKDVEPMMKFMLNHNCPTAMRYPKANLETVERAVAPIELGHAEIIDWGMDGAIIVCGTMLPMCVRVAEQARKERGLDIGIINARFIKPLDKETILRAVKELPFVITIEEGTLEGGFGSTVLEAANTTGLDSSNITRLGLPDRFVEHAERHELLHDLGLDEPGLMATILKLTEKAKTLKPKAWTKEKTA